ncbi:MAG TPA: glycosyltransferase family A protein [Candidatus Andersenbacteria bacterium]|nr:glycosyltransferase family A protein [Candidatus Andersenbacteria bacterium]
MDPLVSVIIPTKNSAQTIGACIDSIYKQSYKNIECIVIDNYSSDATQEIVLKKNANLLTGGDERAMQRNRGAFHAKGRFLLFIDSDMELAPHLISECVGIATYDHQIKAIVIPEESFGTTFWAKCKQFERSCYISTSWLHAARFYKRSAFDYIQGFDPNLIGGEDFDIQTKTIQAFTNSSIGYSTEKILHNEGSLTLVKLLKKKYYYGTTLYPYHHSRDKKHFRLQANPLYRMMLFFKHPLFMLQHPVIFFGTCLMKWLEFSALAIGHIVGTTLY